MPLKLTKREGASNWYLHGTIGGQRVRESSGTSDKAQAEAIRIRRETEIWNRRELGPKAVATFPEALNIYLDRGGEDRFVGKLLTHFKTTRLASIDQGAMERAARILYPKAAASTVNRQLFVPMTAILNVGADCGLCDRPRFTKRREKKTVRRAVKPEWLIAVMDEASPHLRALLAFSAFSGTRISEACRLTWADVDLKAGAAVLNRTKTKPRRVALPGTVIAAIANIPGPRDDDLHVFQYANRFGPITALKTACKRAKVEYYSPHEIGRHTFATWMLSQGHTLAEVAEAGGWASITLVKDVYGHLEQSGIDDSVRGLDAVLAQNRHSAKSDTTQATGRKRKPRT